MMSIIHTYEAKKMGSGRWTSDDWDDYTTSTTAGKTTREIYSKSKIFEDFDPKNVELRESRDSEDNPNSNAIIVALDVTGSMSCVLDAMAREGLNTLAQEIYDRKPVADPHIMYMGVGDVEAGDEAPLQVTQFEADIRIAEQLKDIWLEQGGGGNQYESYNLPWYFAGMYTSIDCFEKRGKKGYLFTVGDEGVPGGLSASMIEKVTGKRPQGDLTLEDMLNMASRTYEVYHIIVEEGWYFKNHGDSVTKKWKEILGQRVINLSDHKKLSEVIVSAIQLNEGIDKADIVDSWDGSTSLVVDKALSSLTAGSDTSGGVVTFD